MKNVIIPVLLTISIFLIISSTSAYGDIEDDLKIENADLKAENEILKDRIEFLEAKIDLAVSRIYELLINLGVIERHN